jgi:hypothetical protein
MKLSVKHVSSLIIIFALAVVILLTALYFYPAEKNNVMPEGNGWRMVYGNAQGNCTSSYNTSDLEGKVLWRKPIGKGINGLLLNGKNVVYAAMSYKISVLNMKGSVLWELNMNFTPVTPAIDEYGNIYAALSNGRIISTDENGHIRWEYDLGNNESASSPIIVENDRVYIITNFGALYILNDEGKCIAKANLGAKTSIPPVISSKGDIYVGSSNSVYKISSQGSIEWNLTLDGKILRMAFYEEHLYVTTLKVVYSQYSVVKNITPYLFSLSQSGRIKWKIDLNSLGAQLGAPIGLAVDNSIYVAITPTALPSGGYAGNTSSKVQNHSFIMKFDTQGHLIWKRGFYKVIEGLAISKDGFIYATFSKYEVMSGDGPKIYALNSQGSPLWQVSLNRTWTYISAPIIGPNAVYVSASYYYYPSYGVNYIYAIG